jgi:hypothetical protein
MWFIGRCGRIREGTGYCWGSLDRILVFFVCSCFKYLRVSSCLNALFHLQLTNRMRGSLPPYPWVFVARRSSGRHVGRFCILFLYSGTKGRDLLSPGARHCVIEHYGRNYFSLCQLLFLHEIQIAIFWNAVCRGKLWRVPPEKMWMFLYFIGPV